MEYGDPDGHGVYGQLTTGNDGGLICHECGQERRFLGRHLREHGLSAVEYRQRHGLRRTAPLASEDLRTRFSELAVAKVGSPGWRRFEAARDVDAALQEARRVQREEPLAAEARHALTVRALVASRSRPARVCDVPKCGRKHVANGWCRTHLERWKRHGDVQADIPVRPRRGGPQAD